MGSPSTFRSPALDNTGKSFSFASEMNLESFHIATSNFSSLKNSSIQCSNVLLAEDVKNLLMAISSNGFTVRKIDTLQPVIELGPTLSSFREDFHYKSFVKMCKWYLSLRIFSLRPFSPQANCINPYTYAVQATIKDYLNLYEKCIVYTDVHGVQSIGGLANSFSWARKNLLHFTRYVKLIVDAANRITEQHKNFHKFYVELKVLSFFFKQACDTIDFDSSLIDALFLKNCFQPYLICLKKWLFEGFICSDISDFDDKSYYCNSSIEDVNSWTTFLASCEIYNHLFQIPSKPKLVTDVLICGKSLQLLQHCQKYQSFTLNKQPVLALGFSYTEIVLIKKNNICVMIEQIKNILKEYEVSDSTKVWVENWAEDIVQSHKNKLTDLLFHLTNSLAHFPDTGNLKCTQSTNGKPHCSILEQLEDTEDWISSYPTCDKSTNMYIAKMADYLNDHCGDKKEIIDYLQTERFSKTVEECILFPVYKQIELVNRCLIMHFFTKEKLYDHLEVLLDVFLLRDGYFGQNLCEKLHKEISEVESAGHFYSHTRLNEILQDILHYHSNPTLQFLSLEASCAPELFSTKELDVLKYLKLKYTVNFPCNIIITEASLKTYNRVFILLLQMRFVLCCYDNLWFFVKKLSELPGIWCSFQYRRILFWKHEIVNFLMRIEAFLGYFMHTIKWKKFIHNIKTNVENILDFRNAHSLFVEECAQLYDMGNSECTIYNLLLGILHCAQMFHKIVTRREWVYNTHKVKWEHPSFSNLKKSYEIFVIRQNIFDRAMIKLSEENELFDNMGSLCQYFTKGVIISS